MIQEEENSFLQTLAHGIQKFENYASKLKGKEVDGDFAFELYDTYGFPIDLTQLLASEKGLSVDMDGFNRFRATKADPEQLQPWKQKIG